MKSTPGPCLSNLTDPEYGVPKPEQLAALQSAVKSHVDSFNFMLYKGLSRATKSLRPIEFETDKGKRVSISLTNVSIGVAKINSKNIYGSTLKLYPAECRSGGTTYNAPLGGRVTLKVDGVVVNEVDKMLARVPIMVKSAACNLKGLSPKELIAKGEEAEEMGGYFIVNGNEKVLRMTILPRRNYPLCVNRPRWKMRGPMYTEYGVSISSVKQDQSSVTSVLHYLDKGAAVFSFVYMKQQFFLPICMVMRALVNADDYSLYSKLIQGKEDNQFYKSCVTAMLREMSVKKLFTQLDVQKMIGSRFKVTLDELPPWLSDVEVCNFLMNECVLPHLSTAVDKINLLVSMTRKLFSFAAGECCAESPDSPANQELLLPGHLYTMMCAERLRLWLSSVKANILKKIKIRGDQFTFNDVLFNEVTNRGLDIGRGLDYLLATGNTQSKSGMGLMQASGLSVIADKLNFYRYLSHFRAVHRGAFFTTMRSTSVRKLLPEAWGFLCPVHTPDGTPCGLLNHLTALCEAVNVSLPTKTLEDMIYSSGVYTLNEDIPGKYANCYEVFLNGKVMGYIPDHLTRTVCDKLRIMKVKGTNQIPPFLEIGLVPKTEQAGQYPGVHLFTSVGRMMRPVINMNAGGLEFIGSFEQVYMDIAVTKEESFRDDMGKLITTHHELSSTSMLSYVAQLTPFSDFNQSPRNMYQCQMGKQTMGTPLSAYRYRSDNKLYRIQTPQSPLVRPKVHDDYGVDEYPLGTNAIVAVISYTGYDMEDAFILNRGSFERGFGHGTVIKSEFIDLNDLKTDRSRHGSMMFYNDGKDEEVSKFIGPDGLPHVGLYVQEGDPLYSYYDNANGKTEVKQYRSSEAAYVETIKILGHELGNAPLNKICITYRIPRNPIIGDKFASRAGQKGICSQKWPVENMPFSETGITPDILFNPHGYPSRMTIGMMIETMAGKSAACHGIPYDATPFTFSEEDSAVDYFGKTLLKAGYNYYGTERLYSGVNGREMEADIFVGVVYYQRLRHMVSDKFQVRTTGTYDMLTQQPVKGRKKGGGVRFGEMERDGLLSHGTAFLLQDRLQTCSDLSKAWVCVACGSLLSPLMEAPFDKLAAVSSQLRRDWKCKTCGSKDEIKHVNIPFSFRYLTTELAAVNIKLKLDIK